jgi:iron complex transport system ATP-binding protein
MMRFDHVSFGYRPGPPLALQEVSLDIVKGGITAVLGPNGAGKSTLLFLALAWLQPSCGRILLDGCSLGRYSRREMGRLMGLVPQREHIPFEYSVLEYVLLGRLPYLAPLEQPGEKDYAASLAALEQVGLSQFANRSVLRLSIGERQLVLIARSLAQQPRLLLLDEPTSHLDLHNKSRLVALLRQLQAQGVTMVMTTHEPELASALASAVVLMNEGRVLFCGPTDEALTTEHMSLLYRLPVEVVTVARRRIVLW